MDGFYVISTKRNPVIIEPILNSSATIRHHYNKRTVADNNITIEFLTPFSARYLGIHTGSKRLYLCEFQAIANGKQ